MTTAQSLILSATAELKETEVSSKKQRGLLEELRAMSKAMVEHEGLLNHAQAALILDVSTRRIGELVETGKLDRFDFLGRTYVSVKQVMERRDSDIKAGRPRLHGVARVKKTLQIMAKADAVNAVLDTIVVPVNPKRGKRPKK